MRTLQANNYQQARQQLEAIDPAAAHQLKAEIPDYNSRHYNIILVRKLNDEIRQRYITKFTVQAFNDRMWEKLEKSYTRMGYHSVIVLHDPTRPKQAPAPPIEETGGAIGPGPESAKEAVSEPFDVNTARVAELREYAEDNGIELAEDDLKADIKKKVKAWQDENLVKP